MAQIAARTRRPAFIVVVGAVMALSWALAVADLRSELAKLDNIHRVAVSPDGREVWAYGANSSTIAVTRVVDGTDTVVASIELPFGDRAPVSTLVFSPDGHFAYLAETPQYCHECPGYLGYYQSIVVIDAVARQVEAIVPMEPPWYPMESAAISPDGVWLYLVVVNFAESREGICVFDTRTRSIDRFVDLPGVSSIAVSVDGGRLYCARGSDFVGPAPNSLSVVDLATWQVLFSVPTGTNPCWVAVTRDGATAVVPNSASADVSIIDINARTLSASVPLGVVPHAAVVNPNGTKAYVGTVGTISNYAQGTAVPVLDLSSRTLKTLVPVGIEPQSIAIGPDGGRVYVSDGNANGLQPAEFHVIDAEQDVYLRRVILRPAARYTPTGIAVSPDGTRAFVLAEGRHSLVVIDVPGRRQIAELQIGPRAVRLSADGRRLYVFCPHDQDGGDGRLVVLDSGTLAVLDAVPLGDTGDTVTWDSVVDRIVLDHTERTAYLTCGERVQVLAVDLASHRVVGLAAIASSGRNVPARGMALATDERRLFVTDAMSQTLVVIDTASFAVAASVPVGNSPSAVRVSADGSRIYILHQHSTEMMSILDAATLATVRTVPYPARVHGEVDLYVPDEHHVTIPWFDPNWVVVFDAGEPDPASQIKALLPTGLDPFNLAVTADGARALVTNFSSDTVSVVDLVSNRILDTIPLGPPPHAVRRRLARP